MKKAELRREFLRKRQQLSAELTSELSARLAEMFFRSVSLEQTNILHIFIAIVKLNEPDTSLIFERIWRDHPSAQTVAPRIDEVNVSMESVAFDDRSELLLNRYGVPEPVGGTVVEPTAVDLVVVPMLCFDELGNRVGYGKGFYDRFLLQCREDCQKVGLSFFEPVSSIEDFDEFDIKLDAVVTPDRLYRWN